MTNGSPVADPQSRNWWWRVGAASVPGAGGDPQPGRAGPAVVFDLDGVLSDATGRQHFLAGQPRDWEGFFDACGDDPLLPDAARLLELLDPSLLVVLLTGRPDRVQPQTVAWLDRHQLRWDLLVMRDRGDYRAARQFKQRTINQLRARGLDLRLGFEDDRANVEMFRAEGLPCVYLASGYYD